MKLSPAGARFIQSWESCSLTMYLDAGGKPTIGFGHLLEPNETITPITQDEADALFDVEAMHFADEVSALVTVDLRQHEFDCLVSFSYNCGHEALAKSTLLKRINAEDFAGACCELTRWVNVDGKPSIGLFRRRAGEQAVLLLADYTRTP
jgi:lysozyme